MRLVTSVPTYILLVLSLPLHPLLLGFLLGIALAAVIVAKAWMEIGRKTWLSPLTLSESCQEPRGGRQRGDLITDGRSKVV